MPILSLVLRSYESLSDELSLSTPHESPPLALPQNKITHAPQLTLYAARNQLKNLNTMKLSFQ